MANRSAQIQAILFVGLMGILVLEVRYHIDIIMPLILPILVGICLHEFVFTLRNGIVRSGNKTLVKREESPQQFWLYVVVGGVAFLSLCLLTLYSFARVLKSIAGIDFVAGIDFNIWGYIGKPIVLLLSILGAATMGYLLISSMRRGAVDIRYGHFERPWAFWLVICGYCFYMLLFAMVSVVQVS